MELSVIWKKIYSIDPSRRLINFFGQKLHPKFLTVSLVDVDEEISPQGEPDVALVTLEPLDAEMDIVNVLEKCR